MDNSIWIYVIGFIVYVSLYLTFISHMVRRKKQRRTESKTKLFKALIEGLRSGSIATVEDVVNVYKGVAGLSSEDISYRYGLSDSLRELLVSIVSRDKHLIEDALDDETIRDWKEKVSNFIQQNEATSPYADLPSTERNILNDISIFLERNDTESVKRKMLELAGMIQARYNDLDIVRNINKWTVPLSIIGFILTVLFGILAWIRL